MECTINPSPTLAVALGTFTEVTGHGFKVAGEVAKDPGQFQAAVVQGLTQEVPKPGGGSLPVAGPALLAVPGLPGNLSGQQVDRTPPGSQKTVPFEVDQRLRPGVASAFPGTGPTVREEPHLPKPRASEGSGSSKFGASYPEATVELPDSNQVVIVEATLDVRFRILKEGSGARHKKLQVPNTILNAARLYRGEKGKPVRFKYAIFAPERPTEDVRRYLEDALTSAAAKGITVDIHWIIVPTGG